MKRKWNKMLSVFLWDKSGMLEELSDIEYWRAGETETLKSTLMRAASVTLLKAAMLTWSLK